MRLNRLLTALTVSPLVVGACLLATAPQAHATSQMLCGINTVTVPEFSSGTTAAFVQTGDKVTVRPRQASTIWAGVWFTGANGPTGWNTTAPGGYPAPGARQYSLLLTTPGSGWSYAGTDRSFTHTGSAGSLRLRTNDNVPGNGNGAFVADITVCHLQP